MTELEGMTLNHSNGDSRVAGGPPVTPFSVLQPDRTGGLTVSFVPRG